jgi:hypothetical protein
MNVRASLFATIIILLTTTSGWAQEYQLDWDQVNKVSAAKGKDYTLNWEDVSSHVDRADPAAVTAELPKRGKVAMMGPVKNVTPPPVVVKKLPTFNIEFSASQYYDTYAERYLQVAKVEVETFRKGTYSYETFENRGCWTSFPVYLKSLKEGERFRVRVVWDNGSNRTIDKTVDSFTASTFYIDEPDYLAYSGW